LFNVGHGNYAAAAYGSGTMVGGVLAGGLDAGSTVFGMTGEYGTPFTGVANENSMNISPEPGAELGGGDGRSVSQRADARRSCPRYRGRRFRTLLAGWGRVRPTNLWDMLLALCLFSPFCGAAVEVNYHNAGLRGYAIAAALVIPLGVGFAWAILCVAEE